MLCLRDDLGLTSLLLLVRTCPHHVAHAYLIAHAAMYLLTHAYSHTNPRSHMLTYVHSHMTHHRTRIDMRHDPTPDIIVDTDGANVRNQEKRGGVILQVVVV